MKDNFSLQSHQYVKFRPGYPREMFDYLLSLVECTETAWDCATGNGQMAVELSPHFKSVYATDISGNISMKSTRPFLFLLTK